MAKEGSEEGSKEEQNALRPSVCLSVCYLFRKVDTNKAKVHSEYCESSQLAAKQHLKHAEEYSIQASKSMDASRAAREASERQRKEEVEQQRKEKEQVKAKQAQSLKEIQQRMEELQEEWKRGKPESNEEVSTNASVNSGKVEIERKRRSVQ